LRFEKLAQGKGLAVKLIPVPRIISSSCGIAARFPEGILPEVIRLTNHELAELEAVFSFFTQGEKLCMTAIPGPWDKI
jgi:hypothetical protein